MQSQIVRPENGPTEVKNAILSPMVDGTTIERSLFELGIVLNMVRFQNAHFNRNFVEDSKAFCTPY